MRYVLVHGGGSTGRFWDRVVGLLDAPAIAVDLPGRGAKPADLQTLTVDDEVASVLDDLSAVDDDVVLVAHSSGGLVVPGVVHGLGSRVQHVVLNAALVPAEGGCGIDCMQPRHREGLVAAVEHARATGAPIPELPGAPDDPEPLRRAYGGDPLDDDTLAFVADPVRCVPDTVHHYFQPVHWSLAAAVPVTYLRNDRDRPIPPALQDELIARLPRPPRVVHHDGGHLPAVTAPEQLAEVLRSVREAPTPGTRRV